MLTLPGDIEGLLRPCSPVQSTWSDGKLYTGVLSAVWPMGARMHIGTPVPMNPEDYRAIEGELSSFRLLLTDATARAHAAWWLLGAATADRPGDYRRQDWFILSFRWELPPGKRLAKWRFSRLTIGHLCLWNSTDQGGPWPVCPTLADLDPDDPRMLPDGSRWVDTEALRRVCLHAAGRES